MKSYRLIGGLLLVSIPVVQSFIVTNNPSITTKTTTTTQLCAKGTGPLYLQHVDALHPHHDSVVRLEDEFYDDDKQVDKKNHSLHYFTNHLAPVVLALYMVGHYLSTYHATSTALVEGSGGTSINVDPMFGGYVLIAAGLYMVKWSIDNAFLSPA